MRKKVTEVVVAHNGRDARRLIIRRVIPFPWPYLLGLLGCLLCGVLVLSFAGYTLPLSPSPYTVKRTQILTAYGQSPDDPTWTIDVEGNENLRILSDSTVRLKISGAAATPGYVGIGTTTPAQLLHVAGNATVTGNLGVGTTSPAYKLDVSGDIRATNNCYVGGNLGVGTTSPSYKLDVNGNVRITGAVVSVGGDPAYSSDNFTIKGANLRLYHPVNSYGYGCKINFGDADFVYIQEDANNNLTIYGYNRIALMGGNVGVGTTSPAYKLDVNGEIRATGNIRTDGGNIYHGTDSRLNIYNNNNATDSRAWIELWGYDASTGRTGELCLAGTYIDFRYGDTDTTIGPVGMRLDSSGRLGIGTTSPAAMLDVSQTIRCKAVVSKSTPVFSSENFGGLWPAVVVFDDANVVNDSGYVAPYPTAPITYLPSCLDITNEGAPPTGIRIWYLIGKPLSATLRFHLIAVDDDSDIYLQDVTTNTTVASWDYDSAGWKRVILTATNLNPTHDYILMIQVKNYTDWTNAWTRWVLFYSWWFEGPAFTGNL